MTGVPPSVVPLLGAIAVLLALETVVSSGERNVRFDELGRLFEHALEGGARLFELAFAQIDGAHLVEHAQVSGPHQQGPVEQLAGARIVLILLEQHGQVEVRLEVHGVLRQLLFERGAGGGHVAAFHLRAAEVGVDVGQVRIQLRCFAQVRERVRVFEGVQLGRAEQQAGFRRIALPQDAVEDALSEVRLLVAQQCRAEHVRNREIVLVLVFDRSQQLDHFGVLALAQPAVAQQEDDLPVARLLLVQTSEFRRGARDLVRLVVGQRQVQRDGKVMGASLESFAVLGDGFGVAAGASKRRSEVRARINGLGPHLEIGLVAANGRVQVASPVGGDGLLEDLLGRLLGAHEAGEDEQSEREKAEHREPHHSG